MFKYRLNPLLLLTRFSIFHAFLNKRFLGNAKLNILCYKSNPQCRHTKPWQIPYTAKHISAIVTKILNELQISIEEYRV